MAKFLATIALSVMLVFPVFAQEGKVNINTANAQQLDTLKGIGPKKAQAIIDYRKGFLEENQDSKLVFETPMDLTQVRGIGPKTVEKNLDVIIVEDEVEEVETDEEVAPSTPDEQAKNDCITDSQCEDIKLV